MSGLLAHRGLLLPGSGDPYFANVVSLLHFDGADGSSTFTDQTGRSWTRTGTAQIVTANAASGFGQSGYGQASTGSYVTAANSTDWVWNATSYTVECRVFIPTGFANGILLGYGQPTSPTDNWHLEIDASRQLVLFWWTGSNNFLVGTSQTIPLDTWTPVSFTADWNGSNQALKLFVAGLTAGSATKSNTHSVATSTFAVWQINSSHLTCQIDELRITKGVARYTSDYTPSSSPFPNFQG
jgi:hypothetical protein